MVVWNRVGGGRGRPRIHRRSDARFAFHETVRLQNNLLCTLIIFKCFLYTPLPSTNVAHIYFYIGIYKTYIYSNDAIIYTASVVWLQHRTLNILYHNKIYRNVTTPPKWFNTSLYILLKLINLITLYRLYYFIGLLLHTQSV